MRAERAGRVTMKPAPPRLSMLLASEAPMGVVFRRGPTKLVRLLIWNRETDRFKPGPVFRGRLFAERSDISPDGRHLLYFAMAGVKWAVAETGGTWTAISELPTLKAAALWGQGDTWAGGGYFLSNSEYWLEADGCTRLIRDQSGLRRFTYRSKLPFRSRGERDGWSALPRAGKPVLENKIRHEWTLRKPGPRTGYELEAPGEPPIRCPNWQWAEWDRARLAWAESGRLMAARVGAEKLGTVRCLCDFNLDPAANPDPLP